MSAERAVSVPSESDGLVVVVIDGTILDSRSESDLSRSRSLAGVLVEVARMLVRDGVLNDALAADLLLTSLLRPIRRSIAWEGDQGRVRGGGWSAWTPHFRTNRTKDQPKSNDQGDN